MVWVCLRVCVCVCVYVRVCVCVCVCGRTATEKDLRCDILSRTCDVIGGTNTSCFIFA